jgi:hypothetical protein
MMIHLMMSMRTIIMKVDYPLAKRNQVVDDLK